MTAMSVTGRYERDWPLGSTEYHLQAAEREAKALYQALAKQDGTA